MDLWGAGRGRGWAWRRLLAACTSSTASRRCSGRWRSTTAQQAEQTPWDRSAASMPRICRAAPQPAQPAADATPTSPQRALSLAPSPASAHAHPHIGLTPSRTAALIPGLCVQGVEAHVAALAGGEVEALLHRCKLDDVVGRIHFYQVGAQQLRGGRRSIARGCAPGCCRRGLASSWAVHEGCLPATFHGILCRRGAGWRRAPSWRRTRRCRWPACRRRRAPSSPWWPTRPRCPSLRPYRCAGAVVAVDGMHNDYRIPCCGSMLWLSCLPALAHKGRRCRACKTWHALDSAPLGATCTIRTFVRPGAEAEGRRQRQGGALTGRRIRGSVPGDWGQQQWLCASRAAVSAEAHPRASSHNTGSSYRLLN